MQSQLKLVFMRMKSSLYYDTKETQRDHVIPKFGFRMTLAPVGFRVDQDPNVIRVDDERAERFKLRSYIYGGRLDLPFFLFVLTSCWARSRTRWVP